MKPLIGKLFILSIKSEKVPIQELIFVIPFLPSKVKEPLTKFLTEMSFLCH